LFHTAPSSPHCPQPATLFEGCSHQWYFSPSVVFPSFLNFNLRLRAEISEKRGQLSAARQQEAAVQERVAESAATNQELAVEVAELKRQLTEQQLLRSQLEGETSGVDQLMEENQRSVGEQNRYNKREELLFIFLYRSCTYLGISWFVLENTSREGGK
jgi:regulator of replication initiation timing